MKIQNTNGSAKPVIENSMESRRTGKIDKKQKGYDAQPNRWDSIEKWNGSKVTVWISPNRASALWLYAKHHKLPLLPTEVLYHILDGLMLDPWETSPSIRNSQTLGQELVRELHERLDQMNASNNEALNAISTVLLELLGHFRPDLLENKHSPSPVVEKSNIEMTGVLVRQWLDNLKASTENGKPKLVVAALVLPKTVALAQGLVGCQVSAIQINGQRVAGPSTSVLLPSLTVHTAVKKEPTGTPLLIARLKLNSWSIELVDLSADGKQKSALATFEI